MDGAATAGGRRVLAAVSAGRVTPGHPPAVPGVTGRGLGTSFRLRRDGAQPGAAGEEPAAPESCVCSVVPGAAVRLAKAAVTGARSEERRGSACRRVGGHGSGRAARTGMLMEEVW